MKYLIILFVATNFIGGWDYYAKFNAIFTAHMRGIYGVKVRCYSPEAGYAKCVGTNDEVALLLSCSTEHKEVCSGWIKDL